MANRVDVRAAIGSMDEFMKDYVPEQYGVLANLYKNLVSEVYLYNLKQVNEYLYRCIDTVDKELLKNYANMCDGWVCTKKLTDFVLETGNTHLEDLVKNDLGQKERAWLDLLPDFVKYSNAELLNENDEYAPWLRLVQIEKLEAAINKERRKYQDIYKKYLNIESDLYADNEAILGLDIYVNKSKDDEEWIFEYILIDVLKECFDKHLDLAKQEVLRITELACGGTGEFDYTDIDEEVIRFVSQLLSELSELYRETIKILAEACDQKQWLSLYTYAQEWTTGIRNGLENEMKSNWEKLFNEEKKGFSAFAENTDQADIAKDIAKALETKVCNSPMGYFNLDVNVLNPIKEEGIFESAFMVELIEKIQKKEDEYEEIMKKYYLLAQDKTKDNACLAPLVPMVTAVKNLDISNLRIYLELFKELEEDKLDSRKGK